MFAVLDPDHMKKWNPDKPLNEIDLKDPKLLEEIFDGLMVLANGAKFNSLEKPKQIQLLADPWTIENEYLTPTMKMKRNVAKNKLAEEIKDLYTQPVLKEKK
jgi:long-chain acyl-CoA synthetase